MSQARKYSVLVAEDEPLIRENLVKKLGESCPEFEVVGQAADGREALDEVAELYPDVLITDIRMPVIDGLALTRELYYTYPDILVIIVSGYDEFSYARTALSLGVKEYLLKPVAVADLCAAMAKLYVQLEGAREKFDTEHPSFPAMASQEELVSVAQEYLRTHFAEEISLAELAARFHVNPPYLARLFKRTVGAAPVRYLRDLRINQARKLLEERPELEIKEVGIIAGYPDQGYFSRVFRQAVGVSPQEYREGRAGKGRRKPPA
jgi:YesN/AraC family two-component response regulator